MSRNIIGIILGVHPDFKRVWIKNFYIGITCLVSLSTSFIIPTYLFSQEENTKKNEEDNAAVYYSKAFDLLKYPFPGEKESYNKLRSQTKNCLIKF